MSGTRRTPRRGSNKADDAERGETCPECKAPIRPEQAREAVRIMTGLCHAACYAALRRSIDKIFADAIADGTHSVKGFDT